jgi:hypothetical protein
MGFYKIILIFLLFIIFCSQNVLCDDETFIVTPIEQLQTGNALIRDLQQQILTFDDYSRLNALSSMEKIIKIGSIDAIKYELLSLLYYLSTYTGRDGNEQSALHTRKKAVELLGRLGEKAGNSRFTRDLEDVLLTLLRSDDIEVVSSTIFALGRLGCNTTGKTVKAISLTVDKWTHITRDKTFALAVITSTEMIAEANNGIDKIDGYSILIKIIQSNNDEQIRKKAFDVMNELNSYRD